MRGKEPPTVKLSVRIDAELWQEAQKILTPPGHTKVEYGSTRIVLEQALRNLIEGKKRLLIESVKQVKEIFSEDNNGNQS